MAFFKDHSSLGRAQTRLFIFVEYTLTCKVPSKKKQNFTRKYKCFQQARRNKPIMAGFGAVSQACCAKGFWFVFSKMFWSRQKALFDKSFWCFVVFKVTLKVSHCPENSEHFFLFSFWKIFRFMQVESRCFFRFWDYGRYSTICRFRGFNLGNAVKFEMSLEKKCESKSHPLCFT